MNYAKILRADVVNSCNGFGCTLFVSGCSRGCKGCFNPEAWDCNFGKPFDDAAKQEADNNIAEAFKEKDISYAEENDKQCGQHTLVFDEVERFSLLGERIVRFHASQFEERLNQQNNGEHCHADDHNPGECGGLHSCTLRSFNVVRLQPGPDLKHNQNKGDNQVGKRFGFRLFDFQKSHILYSN